MVKQWFVLHTLTGQENKAQKSIEARVKLERMEEYIGRCVIPTERVTEKKDGRKRTITKKFFPGYVLAELALYDEAKGLDENGKKAIFERTWQFLRETPGVIGFVGGDRPQPLKQSEVDSILLDRPSTGAMAERPKVDFSRSKSQSSAARSLSTSNTGRSRKSPSRRLSSRSSRRRVITVRKAGSAARRAGSTGKDPRKEPTEKRRVERGSERSAGLPVRSKRLSEH